MSDVVEAKRPKRDVPVIVAIGLVLLLIGFILCPIAFGVAFGVWTGVGVFALLCFALGIVIGLTSNN